MQIDKVKFGKILKELRTQKHMTQDQLAELIDKSSGAIGQLERGDIYPNYETLARIINALDVDANLFFSRESSQHNDISDWISDAIFGMKDEDRETIGKFLLKFSNVMLKKS